MPVHVHVLPLLCAPHHWPPCALCSGLYPLQFLVNQFVKTPVTSLVALVNANGVSLDGWFALSGDVQLQNLALT